MKLKLTWRLWLLIIVLLLSILAIINFSGLETGVLITSVDQNSSAFDSGLRKGQIITSIDGKTISSVEDFTNALAEKFNTNESVKTIITTKETEAILFSPTPPQITVSPIPKTNLKLGLDLEGGARALIKAQDRELTQAEVNDLISVVNNRLNVYGITDLKVLPVSDLAGQNFILIEIAGTTPSDLEELISQQGKFEAKIANETVFIGGERDITSVCRNDATCAGIEACYESETGGHFCNFRFSVFLSEDAAKRHADITKNLAVNATAQGNYLSERLDLFLDDTLVDSLLISEGLQGRVTTQITISGSGSGDTREDAITAAEEQMHNLQTILITGSLPFKLEVVKLDTISPLLGEEFINTILLAGLIALVAVAIIIFIRYKNIKSSLALLLISISEVVIILGVAAIIDWNLDLPSIAGILATIGTGIDDLIIVIDESKTKTHVSLKQRIKRAFTIILGAYFTSAVSLLPLLWAGAGLLKGFAITTLIGISVGVFITRPAFADMVKRFEE